MIRFVLLLAPFMVVLGALLAAQVAWWLVGSWVAVMLVVAHEHGHSEGVRDERESRWVRPGAWR